MGNSLQEVLNRAKSIEAEPESKTNNEKKKNAASEKKEIKKSRGNTVLIGGHFPPEVSKQLRIIAAEEGTTNQALLNQALDLLFTKKGKKLIIDL
jgi:hypothetical protein